MVVADVSDPIETSQSTDRDAEQRVGLGLLSRFIGAVFLVLLGGLLLLDRALQRANYNQAALDAQSAALLTEAFMPNHTMILERAAELAALPLSKSTAPLRAELSRLLASSGAV